MAQARTRPGGHWPSSQPLKTWTTGSLSVIHQRACGPSTSMTFSTYLPIARSMAGFSQPPFSAIHCGSV